MNFTRRDFGKLALAAAPASSLLAAKPDSKWGGVQVGINAPYSFTRMSGTADKILEYMTQLNLSAAELRLQPVEAYLNAPGVYASANDAPGRGGAPAGGGATDGSGPVVTLPVAGMVMAVLQAGHSICVPAPVSSTASSWSQFGQLKTMSIVDA